MNPDVPVENRILMLVEDVDDYSQNKNELERIRPLFAPGSGPSKEGLSRYTAYRYEGKTPVRSGDSATIAVAIKDAKTGNPAGEMQWSAIKVNNIWRLKDAPLPDARK
jgi:hypothetical protein